MDFPGKLKDFGPVDLGPLPQQVARVSENVWRSNTLRQDTFRVHRETVSLIFRFLKDHDGTYEIVDHPIWMAWKDAITPILDRIRSLYPYPEGQFWRIMLANLRAGAEIPTHRDSHESFAVAHRLHVPILTNEQAIFVIDGDSFHLSQGRIYEVNNRAPHSVANLAATDRVHLIADYFPG